MPASEGAERAGFRRVKATVERVWSWLAGKEWRVGSGGWSEGNGKSSVLGGNGAGQRVATG
jgi:hypothetical protein